jgi:hypothetical protein
MNQGGKMDYTGYAIAGVPLIPLILGLVEFAKKLGVQGKWNIVMAMALGIFYGGLYFAMQESLIPPEWVPLVGAVVFVPSFALAACGLYDLAKKFLVRE